MTRTLILLLTLGAGGTFPTKLPIAPAGLTGAVVGDMCWPDDIMASFGGTCAAPDYWLEYDSTDTRLELWSTTAGMVAYVEDGGDDWVFIGGLELGDVLDLADNDGKNLDDLWADPVATDAAPRVTVLGTQPVFVEPGATNVTGANLVLAPSPGERTLDDVTLAGTTGDTLTFDVYSNGVVAQTVKTEGVDWDCDGAGTDIICVCNLWDDFVANPIVGAVVTRTDVTCSDEKLTFSIDPGVSEYLAVTTSDDVNLDMTIGVGGQVLLPAGTAATPGLSAFGDPNTGLRIRDDVVYFSTGGVDRAYVSNAGVALVGAFSFSRQGSTRQAFIADGQTRFCNAAETNCYTFGASAPDTATLWDKAGTGAGILEIGSGDIQFGGSASYYIDGATGQINIGGVRTRIYQTADNNTVGSAMLTINSAGAAEMIASSGVQYGNYLVPEVLQTNTAAFSANETVVTDSSSGSGQDYLERQRWGATGPYQFKRQDDGDMLLHEDPGSDTAPLDGKIVAANAYALATGVARNGANLGWGAGIRTLQIVCSDRTLTDTDTATFVVDGVDTVLTESTDFDCHGTGSEEICCDNLGTAITTNVATIKMVPDCDTTAGTCYLTPMEDVLWVEDIFYLDGGVDNVGWTLTEGVDGDIGLYADNILTKIWDVDYVVRAGTSSFPPASPAWGVNDSCAGLAWDADAEYADISFEIPSCWAGRARDDLVLKIYWCPEDAQAPADTEVVKWDISYRVLEWGTDDVDTGAAVTNSVAYTQSGAGDEGDTFIHEIVIDADDTDQPLVAGEVLALHFDRDWGDAANYPHDAIVPLWEIQVPQTSLKCDHHN